MPKLTFFNLGNADCTRIDLANDDQLLFDYAAMRDANDPSDKRCDLAAELRRDLRARGRQWYRVVGFTHLDRDHICGSSEFFYLEHAQKYQEGPRIKINELWVPAAAITEEGCEEEDRIIRAEARYRLKKGKGIRVFSRPEALKDWLEAEGISFDERKHLITDAGQLVPGFTTLIDGVEFFVHSPFAARQNECELVDRNGNCLVLHATFVVGQQRTKVFLGADAKYESLVEIVNITRFHQREDRLEWDVMKIPHHSSYLSIGPEKGKDKTKPVPETAYLYEDMGLDRAIMISTSCPIPSNDESNQPPHRQAAKYYQDCSATRSGKYRVTMEHPRESRPEPLVVEIDGTKARIVEAFTGGITSVVSRPAHRAGANG
jgi:hypothetical protein